MPVGHIYQQHTAGQTFTAAYSGLDRVSLFLASYARTNRQPVTFRLRRRSPAGADVASVTFAADTVQDNQWRTFTFDPVPDSAGQTFYLSLDSPASRLGDAITVWRSEGDRYPDGDAWRDGQPLDGDLAFAAHFRGAITEVPGMLLRQLTVSRPAIWGDARYYVALVAGYLALFLIFWLSLVSALPLGPAEE